MTVVKSGVIFLALLLFLPSRLLAFEVGQGTSGETGSVLHAASQPATILSDDQYRGRIGWDTSSEDEQARSLNIEAHQPEPEVEAAAEILYTSNPAATRAIDKSISLFTNKIKERFSLYLERSGKYLELMKEILKAYNIPEDIAFLPLIESGFNPEAYSVARAVGPWQFIAGTAKKYGLKIDWWRDERKDPVKSTQAAANYLKDLYEMFGSWNLAMAAYNAGEGKILRALTRSKSDNYWALLNTRHIKRETKEYVPRFIAAKMIATDPGAYGFGDLDYHAPFAYDEVFIDSPIDLEAAARCAETSLQVIKELNPEIRRWSTPPNVSPYPLRIPVGKKEIFMENLSRVPDDERFSVARYTVRRGDTLTRISKRTGFPVAVIAELNSDGGALRTGDTILIPPRDKFHPDRDDRCKSRKVTSRKANGKKRYSRKMVITSLYKSERSDFVR